MREVGCNPVGVLGALGCVTQGSSGRAALGYSSPFQAGASSLACWAEKSAYYSAMSITLELDEQALASLPLQPGERERDMQIELGCRYYAKGWLSLGQGAQMAALDCYAFGVALAERGIPRQYGMTEALEDVAHSRRQ